MEILVVDDEPAIPSLFKQVFRQELKEGLLTFRFCASAEEALEYIKNAQDIRTILILSDIHMPGMNGLELLRILKKQHPELTVLTVTAYGDDKNRQTATSYGADDFINKPIDFPNLRQKLFAFKQRLAEEGRNSL